MRIKILVIGCIVSIIGSISCWLALTQTPYANGWDSYFYLIQVKSYLEEGAMHSPSASLIYPYLTFFKAITGDYIVGYKMAMSVLCGIFIGLSFLVSWLWSNHWGTTLLITALVLINPGLVFIAAQYPKHMLGMVLLVAFMLLLDHKKSGYAVLLLTVGFFGHKLTFGLSCIMFLVYHGQALLHRKGIIVIACVTVVGVLSTIIFPGLLALADLERLSGMFSEKPTWASAGFVQSIGFERFDSRWLFSLIVLDIIFVAAMLLAVSKAKKLPKQIFALLLPGILFIFPWLSWGEDGLALRMFISISVFTPLLLTVFHWSFRNGIVPYGLLFIGIVVSFFHSYHPGKHDPPYEDYQKMSAKLSKHEGYQSSELIIAHKSLAEFLTFETGKDVMPWLPEYHIDQDKLWRVAADIESGDLRYYLNSSHRNTYLKLMPRYYFLSEKNWQRLLEKARDEKDEQFLEIINTWRNPNRVRPAFLLRNKSEE